MIINEFHIASAACFCIFLIFWFAFYDKAISFGNSFKKTVRRIEKEYSERGDSSFINDTEFRLFRNRKLDLIWRRYLEDAAPGRQNIRQTDISEYFAPENLIPEVINVPLLNLMPFVFFAVAGCIGFGAYLYRDLSGVGIRTDDLWLSVIIAAALLFSVLLAVASKTAVYRTEKWMRAFVHWMTRKYCRTPDIGIRMLEMIRPFIDETTGIINSFVSAATDKQVESMDNMAAHFAARTGEIYGEQIAKISSETTRMSGLQGELAGLLKEAVLSGSAAARNVESITSIGQEVITKYNDNLTRLEEMNLALAGSVAEFTALAAFIRQNHSDDAERISSLAASFEQYMLQHTSAVNTLKTVAEDILNAGQILKNSYGGITTDISQDIEKVFVSFDENLSTISVHLSRSIQELQEAVDELPEILRRTARDL